MGSKQAVHKGSCIKLPCSMLHHPVEACLTQNNWDHWKQAQPHTPSPSTRSKVLRSGEKVPHPVSCRSCGLSVGCKLATPSSQLRWSLRCWVQACVAPLTAACLTLVWVRPGISGGGVRHVSGTHSSTQKRASPTPGLPEGTRRSARCACSLIHRPHHKRSCGCGEEADAPPHPPLAQALRRFSRAGTGALWWRSSGC